MYQKTRAWIELNMENLAYNVEQMKSRLPGNCRLMPAVKANAVPGYPAFAPASRP